MAVQPPTHGSVRVDPIPETGVRTANQARRLRAERSIGSGLRAGPKKRPWRSQRAPISLFPRFTAQL